MFWLSGRQAVTITEDALIFRAVLRPTAVPWRDVMDVRRDFNSRLLVSTTAGTYVLPLGASRVAGPGAPTLEQAVVGAWHRYRGVEWLLLPSEPWAPTPDVDGTVRVRPSLTQVGEVGMMVGVFVLLRVPFVIGNPQRNGPAYLGAFVGAALVWGWLSVLSSVKVEAGTVVIRRWHGTVTVPVEAIQRVDFARSRLRRRHAVLVLDDGRRVAVHAISTGPSYYANDPLSYRKAAWLQAELVRR